MDLKGLFINKQTAITTTLFLLFLQQGMCIFGWGTKQRCPHRDPVEFYGEFNSTRVRDTFKAQPPSASNCKYKLKKEKIDGILDLGQLAEPYRPKIKEVWEFTCRKHNTCEAWYNGIFWSFRDNLCHADVDYYDTTFKYFDWNQQEEYKYCHNAIPHCFIDLREYSCDGIVIHHYDENTTSTEHDRCQWNFITDPTKRVVIEYFRQTEGHVSITALADNEDPKSRVQMFFPKNFTTWDKDKHIIPLSKTNITQIRYPTTLNLNIRVDIPPDLLTQFLFCLTIKTMFLPNKQLYCWR